MQPKHLKLLIFILLAFILVACNDSSKMEGASEDVSLKVSRDFLINIVNFANSDISYKAFAIDTGLNGGSAFSKYIYENGLAEQLSPSFFDYSKAILGESHASDVTLEHLKPLMQYVTGYSVDDFILTYSSNGLVHLKIKPESMKKGVFLDKNVYIDKQRHYIIDENFDNTVANLKVVNIEKEGDKITDIRLVEAPKLLQNKYIWFTNRDEFNGYVKDALKVINDDVQFQQKITERENKVNACEQRSDYSTENGMFKYSKSACETITGSLEVGKTLTISGINLDSSVLDPNPDDKPYTIEMTLKDYKQEAKVYNDFKNTTYEGKDIGGMSFLMGTDRFMGLGKNSEYFLVIKGSIYDLKKPQFDIN